MGVKKKTMNGEITNEVRRGEIYWLRDASSRGGEEAFKRPMLVVSSDKSNENFDSVIGVFLTTKYKYGILNVKTYATGRESWIMCNHVQEVDKSRLMKFICDLPENEMIEVERGLRSALGMNPFVGDLEESEEESADGYDETEDRIAELNHTCSMWRKMYEKALEEIVTLRVERDIADKVEKKNKPEIPRDTVNVNTATWEEMVKIAGLSQAIAMRIVAHRNLHGVFKKKSDLLNVPRFGAGSLKKYGSKLEV